MMTNEDFSAKYERKRLSIEVRSETDGPQNRQEYRELLSAAPL
jgi:hypothetical protein